MNVVDDYLREQSSEAEEEALIDALEQPDVAARTEVCAALLERLENADVRNGRLLLQFMQAWWPDEEQTGTRPLTATWSFLECTDAELMAGLAAGDDAPLAHAATFLFRVCRGRDELTLELERAVDSASAAVRHVSGDAIARIDEIRRARLGRQSRVRSAEPKPFVPAGVETITTVRVRDFVLFGDELYFVSFESFDGPNALYRLARGASEPERCVEVTGEAFDIAVTSGRLIWSERRRHKNTRIARCVRRTDPSRVLELGPVETGIRQPLVGLRDRVLIASGKQLLELTDDTEETRPLLELPTEPVARGSGFVAPHVFDRLAMGDHLIVDGDAVWWTAAPDTVVPSILYSVPLTGGRPEIRVVGSEGESLGMVARREQTLFFSVTQGSSDGGKDQASMWSRDLVSGQLREECPIEPAFFRALRIAGDSLVWRGMSYSSRAQARDCIWRWRPGELKPQLLIEALSGGSRIEVEDGWVFFDSTAGLQRLRL